MKIIISPAKKMNVDTDSFDCRGLPLFLERTHQLLDALRAMSREQLRTLWKCSEPLARLNDERIRRMDLRSSLTPAILAYEGIQYQYMAPGVFTCDELDYIQEHLRILSGFYGLLRPFDGVVPYRLEMQAKLAVGAAADLYAFWGDSLACELSKDTDVILNLASKEYSRSVAPHLPAGVRFITCVFGEEKNGRILEKATLCKMARGEMVRYLAEHHCQTPEQAKRFDRLGFRFSPEHSDENNYVFCKKGR
ncbi:MAG: peroxide stress protein YaaA [Oscillospiraceae bacterium]|nr:peroxide stress protein YaaA [Oscillospiraceae bacterium]